MLKLNKYLEQEDSSIWDIPSVLSIDESISKYDYITVFDDNHGTGNLNNATEFSFTTDNEDIFIVPANSYLLVNVNLTKQDGTAFGADENITIDCNAFNLFAQCRLYLGDEEVERVDHVGISTLLYNLTKYTFSEYNGIRESQLINTEKDFIRKYVTNYCRGNVQLLLPVRKMFAFYHQNSHVFRGVKHRITMTLNDQNKIILKWRHNQDIPDDGKVVISKMVWRIPHVEPRLQMQAKLENMLSKNSILNLRWIAENVIKISPNPGNEIRVPIASSIHKPTQVFVAFQNANRSTNQENSYLNFDHFRMTEASLTIDNISYPDKPITMDFNTKHVQEVYQRFLDACDGGITYEDSYRNFISKFPILHFDVSKHPDKLYENSKFPNIVINVKFDEAIVQDYNMFVIIYNIRDLAISLHNKQMRIRK